MIVATVLWRRLDAPGHDACRLERLEDGWRLAGAAVFSHALGPAALAYEVDCHPDWATRRARVGGAIGVHAVDIAIVRDARGWTLNGVAAPGLGHLVDLDLSFSPSTNLAQIQRVALATGEAAEVPAAWLHPEKAELTELLQRYVRRGEEAYWYEAAGEGYAGLLELQADGFVGRYPGLWTAEALAT